jgi:hypothetical protein
MEPDVPPDGSSTIGLKKGTAVLLGESHGRGDKEVSKLGGAEPEP